MQKDFDENSKRWVFKSDLGYLHLAQKNEQISSLEIRDYDQPSLGQSKSYLQKEADKELSAYFAGKLKNFTLPLYIDGTSFEQKVWQELLEIGYGETRYYSQIASMLGDKNKARAVGKACGSNKIAIIIPCHRVLAIGGVLGGYAYGVLVKRALLSLESKFVQNK